DRFLLPSPISSRSTDPLQELPPSSGTGPRPELTAPRYDSPLLRQYDGTGVGIAYIDTGVYPHPDVSSRIVHTEDWVNHRSLPYDDNGHGTESVGNGSGNGYLSHGLYRGPAPGSDIISCKVLNQYGQGKLSDILKAVNWCIDNKDRYNIRVMNLSLGGRAKVNYQDDPLEQAVTRAVDAGIVVVAAAGNEGPGSGTISSPGDNPRVITVGAVDDNNTADTKDDTVPLFSSRGPTPAGFHKPDVLAPGEGIIGPDAPGTPVEEQAQKYRLMHQTVQWLNGMSDADLGNVPDDTLRLIGLSDDTIEAMKQSPQIAREEVQRVMSATARLPLIDNQYIGGPGSSRATPIVSGVVAEMLQANPYLTPEQVKNVLKGTATVLPGVDADTQGAGEINPEKAVQQALDLRADMEAEAAAKEHWEKSPAPVAAKGAASVTLPVSSGKQAPPVEEGGYLAKQ
ncbi:MAG TPA: S8 family peptidase, partial [Candidatus Xenobia bacterium]